MKKTNKQTNNICTPQKYYKSIIKIKRISSIAPPTLKLQLKYSTLIWYYPHAIMARLCLFIHKRGLWPEEGGSSLLGKFIYGSVSLSPECERIILESASKCRSKTLAQLMCRIWHREGCSREKQALHVTLSTNKPWESAWEDCRGHRSMLLLPKSHILYMTVSQNITGGYNNDITTYTQFVSYLALLPASMRSAMSV